MPNISVALAPDKSISVREEDEKGQVRRTLFVPGQYDADGEWKVADLSDAPEEARQAAEIWWTKDAVAAYQAAHPYVPVPPQQIERAAREQKFAGDADLGALLTRLKAAEPAAIKAHWNGLTQAQKNAVSLQMLIWIARRE